MKYRKRGYKTYKKKVYRKRRTYRKKRLSRIGYRGGESKVIFRKVHSVHTLVYRTTGGSGGALGLSENGVYAQVSFGSTAVADVNSLSIVDTPEFIAYQGTHRFYMIKGVKIEFFPYVNYQSNAAEYETPWNYVMDNYRVPPTSLTTAVMLGQDQYQYIPNGRIKRYWNIQKVMKGITIGNGQKYTGWIPYTSSLPACGAMFKSFPGGKADLDTIMTVHLTGYVAFKDPFP